MFQTYSPSGRFSPSFVIWLILGSLMIAIAGIIYALGLIWIPIIYITILLTVAMGWCVGTLGQQIVKLGKVRNVPIGFGIGLLLTVIGLGSKFAYQYYEEYREEMAIVDLMTLEEVVDENGVPADPKAFEEFKQAIKDAARKTYTFSAHIKVRVNRGWNIGKGGRNGLPIQGSFVYLVWLVEAGIILFIATPMVLSASRQPFAEQLDSWANEAEVVMTLPITNDAMVQKIQSAISVQELLELPIPQTDQSNRIAVYTVNSISGQELEDAYLTVELLEYSVKSNGETEVKKSNLATWVVITSEQRVQLKENAELMSEAIQAYRASLIESQSTENQT